MANFLKNRSISVEVKIFSNTNKKRKNKNKFKAFNILKIGTIPFDN